MESKSAERNPLQALIDWADGQPKPVPCARCGRPLSDEISKAHGVGPVCLGKAEEFLPIKVTEIPVGGSDDE